MILLDVNVLVALAIRNHAHHETATRWFDSTRRAGSAFGVPGIAWSAFVRLATNHRVLSPPLSLAEAFSFIDAATDYHAYRIVEPGPRHLAIFRRMCESSDAHGNLVPDAAIAAIAVENGATVASFDRDFARFPDLRWVVPSA